MSILAYDNNGVPIQATGWPSATNISFNVNSAQSPVFSASTFLIRVVATENCRIAFGVNPTASATSSLVLANVPEYIKVTPGERLAVIQDTTGGTLNVTFCN